jgi:predicted glycoside hydrolase/deacetylase ChbG (UPF0249 family)
MNNRLAERLIVVNADDLGMSTSLNTEILSLMRAGLVSSASVMANGDAVEEAIAHIRDLPHCSFGVHLNITWGRPVGPLEPLRRLLGEGDRFSRGAFDTRFDARLRRAVAQEWCSQVESLRSKGLTISHLDSHEHVHTLPPLFFAFKSVQRQFGIRRARLSKNLYCRELPPDSAPLLTKKALWNWALRYCYRTRTTRWFSDLYSLLRVAREGNIPDGPIEAMVHPGATDDVMMVEEIRELRSGALDTLLFPFRLVGYHAI